MIKEGKDKREKNSNAVIKTEPQTGPQTIIPDATVKEEPGTESHLNGVEEGGGSVPTSSSAPSCPLQDLKPSGLIGSTNAGTVAAGSAGRMRTPSTTSEACLGAGDAAQDAEQEDNSLDKPPVSCGIVKTEINGSSSHEFAADRCEGMPSSSGPLPNGIQPLPSNVINKQPGTMEAQYMQQQSQIFVFSTSLANKSAEAVLLGQFPSIIAYHCAQPGTKKYLEKHPLKMNQFNRQNPAQWLNNLAQMKQKMLPSVGGPLKPTGVGLPGGFQGPPAAILPPEQAADMMWNQNQGGGGGNGGMQPCPAANANPAAGAGPPPGSGPPCPPGNPLMAQGCTMKDSPCLMSPTGNPPGGGGNGGPMQPQHSPGSGSPTGHPGSLAGVKVPDENLTPQQRQHREEQLARLRNMQQMLFPEHQSPGGGPPPDGGGDPAAMGQAMMAQKGMVMPGGPGQVTPTSVAAQIEWQKLQHQFYEERKKKGPSSGLGMGASGIGSPSGNNGGQPPRGVPCSGPRTQGPPPPYHQTPRSASVPTAMPSPNPNSPNNPTSNLSLPSPRAASGLQSPAEPNRQQLGGGGGGGPAPRIGGPGSSPTSLDSPGASRPLDPSNPGTPVSTHLSPSATRKDSSHNCSDFSSASSQTNSSNPQQPAVDGMFCRTLQSLAQQQQQLQQPHPSSKEPNLMPVPSPQQIQYLNTFEGQELTIQKQPNTSLKDTAIRSPSIPPPAGMDGGLQSSGCPGGTPLTPTSLANYPTPTSSELSRFPVPSPHTPTSAPPSSNKRFRGQSPQSQGGGSRGPSMEPPLNKTPTDGGRFLTSSPQDGMGPPNMGPNYMPPMGAMNGPPHFLEVSPGGSGPPPNGPPGGMDMSPTGPGGFPIMRTENLPLNPNGSNNMACNGKPAHFDPISSMAQMSQQLTSHVANSPGAHNPAAAGGMMGPGPGPGGMMPFNSPGGGGGMHPGMQLEMEGGCQGMGQDPGPGPGPQGGQPNFVNMQMQNVPQSHCYSPSTNMGGMMPCAGGGNPPSGPSCASPKPGNMVMGGLRGGPPYAGGPPPGGPQRMMGRPPGPSPYNGANVQVKASAPNTIQYLPAKPQAGNPGPRGPPSLEFLQRFTNPLSNLDSKVPTHNLQYFPNSNQPNMGGHPMPMNRQPNGLMGGINNPQMSGMPGGPNCPPGGPGHPGPHLGNMNGPMMGQMGGMNVPMSGGMMMGPGMGMAPLRGSLRPGGMMRMQQMGGGMFGVPPSPGQPGGPPDQMFAGGPNQNMPGGNFVPGSKSSPMNLGSAPDASQPLPPSMGQSNNFKNSPFIGPTTADPNYAQQFHNFQQQLYATNTRSQMNNQAIGPNQSFFVPK